jgi:hypothetical protein
MLGLDRMPNYMLSEMQMLPVLLFSLCRGKDAVMDKLLKQSHDSHRHTHSIKTIINHQTNID